MTRGDTHELVRFLDSLAKLDPDAMGDLINARVRCNEKIAEHPTVQVGMQTPGGRAYVGLLGILNGWAGTIEGGKFDGYGPISAVMEGSRCVGFRLTTEPQS
jgi:hypothetical protein